MLRAEWKRGESEEVGQRGRKKRKQEDHPLLFFLVSGSPAFAPRLPIAKTGASSSFERVMQITNGPCGNSGESLSWRTFSPSTVNYLTGSSS